MKIPGFLIRFGARQVSKQLDLQEGPMQTKMWFKSKTMWSDIVTVLVGIAGLVDTHFMEGKIATSPAYGVILTILGSMGLYGRAKADTKIG
jgi:hypothetical protein